MNCACTDQFAAEDVEDKIEQFDTQEDVEDEIEQFGDCKSMVCEETIPSAATEWASVAYSDQIDAGASVCAAWEADEYNSINAGALDSAVNKLGEPKSINAAALDSAVHKLGEPKLINAEALNSAEHSVSTHSPDHCPTVSISFSLTNMCPILFLNFVMQASYKSGWDTDGIFDEIIPDCNQLSPQAAFIEECRAIDEGDESQGMRH